ncbi:MAG TPA: hypothetical protein VKD70_05585 [Candidatus Acidoferrum sp.]|nr:hypothetical protein [Candidatus Acidoferrum sp.]
MASNEKRVSRRDFARKAALLGVAAPLVATPGNVSNEVSHLEADQNPPKLPADFPKLSDQSRAEVEERYQTILKQYGGRFSAEQRVDLHRLCFLAQPPLDVLRTYTIQNGDSPALYLKPAVEREKKPAKPAATPAMAPRKSAEAKP